MILDIAVHGQDGPVQSRDIAERQCISLKYLEKLIRELGRAGLIESRRGPQGGHMLAKDPMEITVGDIVRIMEKPPKYDDCACAENDCMECPQSDFCLTRSIWVETTRCMFEKLDSFVIGDLV
ncbi:Rrf2 family transcriptional regulator [Pseudodesulfovibrio sp. zrk46]|uniref:RrF2 family transcriptional regulator n=1 Tax=Pseudodesulfovibrio sp. zrk46 TaxID=2725288 RepID=UPI001FFC6D3F|nr:Rrf2 family transcriptional regulator [Pseudodesulfovibrio sp. zrk46]